MRLLMKYHKYKLNKNDIKRYDGIAKKYGLKLNSKDLKDFLTLSIFEIGLHQKEAIEHIYEEVRNECFDMWEYLSFYERNDIIMLKLNPRLDSFKSFVSHDTTILIPFFDNLLNALYHKEVAILELPQFFHLYTQFKEKLIDINQYGLLPYQANMSIFPCENSSDNFVILHDSEGCAFIKLSDHIEVYPYLKKQVLSASVKKELVDALSEDETLFYDTLISNEVVSKRYIKKYQKALKWRK